MIFNCVLMNVMFVPSSLAGYLRLFDWFNCCVIAGAAVQKVTGSDTVQKLNQSYAMQASKSAVSNAASYTKTGFSTLGSGMKSSFGSFKSSLAGLGVPGTSGGGAANGNNSTVLERDDAAAEALFAGSKDENSTNKSGVANSHGDQI